MSFAAARLTLYAIISSLEDDLRRLIRNELRGIIPIKDALNTELYQRSLSRLTKDYGHVESPQIDDLLYYVDFQDLIEIMNRSKSLLSPSVLDHLKKFTPRLTNASSIRNRVAHSRPLLSSDFPFVWDLANELISSKPETWAELGQTMERIRVNPSFVLGLSIPYFDEEEIPCSHNLPIPDFDETGFIGRSDIVHQLIKLCYGPYPVISIVGEGGIGKTAIALRVAYDILDDQKNPFDAIIWTTSKTTQLTSKNIIEIDNAIRDSLGVFEAVSYDLIGLKSSDPVDEIISYLEEFDVLLVLDNLETVLDDRIRNFLERIPAGTKILITSRIGLGAFEYPIKLAPMKEMEAVELLRSLSRMRSVDILTSLDPKKLSKYVRRMSCNPGYIKWFVSAVQSGQAPEKVLSQPEIFLEFCMSNVYKYLSELSKSVLVTMQGVPGHQSVAELSFLYGDIEPLKLQEALQELLATNMVHMNSIPRGSSFESKYSITELAKAYLDKHHPLTQDQAKLLVSRRKELASAREEIQSELVNNPYSFYAIKTRSKSDSIVAKYLFGALKNIKRMNFQEANDQIDRARALAPEYFEVHRVEAYLRAREGNIPAAREAYEAAIELAPDSAPLRYWYGGFLLRYLDDPEAALEQFDLAAELTGPCYQIDLERARANLYILQFDSARSLLDHLLNSAELPEWACRKVYDLHLQYFQRVADHQAAHRDFIASMEMLEKLLNQYQKCPINLLDKIMLKKLEKSLHVASVCAKALVGTGYEERAKNIKYLLEQEVSANVY